MQLDNRRGVPFETYDLEPSTEVSLVTVMIMSLLLYIVWKVYHSKQIPCIIKYTYQTRYLKSELNVEDIHHHKM